MKILVVSQFEKGSYFYAESFFKIFLKKYQAKKFNCKAYYFNIFNNFGLIISFLIFRPDILFLLKAENINFRIIRFLKKYFKIKIYNFYPDSPFLFHNGNSNSNILRSLPFYKKFFIWNKRLIPALDSAGVKKADFLNFYPDIDLFLSVKNSSKIYKKFDLVFVGCWDEKRAFFLREIIKSFKIKIGIFGFGWKENFKLFQELENVLISKEINFKEMVFVFKNSKISLNILRNQNKDSCNMRTFEIPASNGFMLSQYSFDQAKYFKKGIHSDYFENKKELIFKINFYLKNFLEREKIRKNGFKIVKKYDLKNRLLSKDFFE